VAIVSEASDVLIFVDKISDISVRLVFLVPVHGIGPWATVPCRLLPVLLAPRIGQLGCGLETAATSSTTAAISEPVWSYG
jgi:hypothetical protein